MSVALSLDINFLGQPTPVEAAQWFVVQPMHSAWSVPSEAVWTIRGSDELGVTVATDDVTLHAIQLPNETWVVDSGQRCQ